MIRIDRVTMRFGRAVAVDDVSVGLAPGESVALWGTNGAGKTTLIRCVLGLLRFRGCITVGGHDLRRQGKRARLLIGYVPQELGFYDDLGVAEAATFFSRLNGLPRADIDRTLAEVGLTGHEHKRIRELSGGMKQRLALAIALLGDPPVLVLDEVTASLDAVGREEFVTMLQRLRSEGRTMLFASHRVEEVAALACRVVMLERGKVVRTTGRDGFTADMGRGSTLHLIMGPDVRERAMRCLEAGGFTPRLNGVGVLVPVDRDQKAAPFRALAQDRIPIDDFELVSGPHGLAERGNP